MNALTNRLFVCQMFFNGRFKTSDVPSNVMKAVPDFCTIYVISKGKISSAKKSLKPVPFVSPLHEQIQEQSNTTTVSDNFSTVTPPMISFQVKGIILFPIETHFGLCSGQIRVICLYRKT